MPEQMSGVQLFLRYAWPCAENKLRIGQISQNDFVDLKWFVENKIKPETCFLRKCFPKAIRALEEFAIKEDKDLWTLETVTKYWRYHHGHTGNCAVRFGEVVFTYKDGTDFVKVVEHEPFYVVCVNSYNLKLDFGDQVSFHQLHIVEKIEQGAIEG